MNILLGRIIPSSTFFCSDKSLHYGGDMPTKFMMELAKAHPEDTFYFVTSNNIDKVREFVPSNIINYYDRIKRYLKEKGLKYGTGTTYTVLDDCLKIDNINIDTSFVMLAAFGSRSIWDLNYINDGVHLASPLEQDKRSAAIIYYFSVHPEVKFCACIDDPRCVKHYPLDLLHVPDVVLSQSNESFSIQVYNGYGEASKQKSVKSLNCEFSHFEKVFLIDKPLIDWRKDKRKNLFIETVHGIPERTQIIYDWIYKYDNSAKIYGKWWLTNKACAAKIDKLGMNHEIFEDVPILKMEHLVWNSKYTFVLPVDAKYPSFVTQKIWAMLYYGIVPFYCPAMYDSTHIIKDAPELLKVNSPEEMWTRIEYLEKNPQEYDKLREQMFAMLKPEYFKPEFLVNLIYNRIK